MIKEILLKIRALFDGKGADEAAAKLDGLGKGADDAGKKTDKYGKHLGIQSLP